MNISSLCSAFYSRASFWSWWDFNGCF